MKKNDVVLAIIILVIAGVGLFLYKGVNRQAAGFVTVTVDGEVYGTYSLEKEREIPINDTNHLVIRSGYADMTEADCPDQICVNQKTISKNGESIICLPNKIIVEVVGGKDAALDAVTN